MAWSAANVVSVNEIEQTRDGTSFQSSLHRNYRRQFRVIFDSPITGTETACSAPGIPLPFSPYSTGEGIEFDLASLCVKTSATMQVPDDRMIWIVTCDYSTEMPEGGPSVASFGNDPAGTQNHPENEPWTIGWEPEVISRARQWDLDGFAFTASSGKPFKPAPTIETARPVLTFSRNQLEFGRTDIITYSYAVNSDDFLGAPPGSAQCLPPTAKLMWRGNIMYWRVTWKIRFGNEDLTFNDVGGYEQFSPMRLLDQDTFHRQNAEGAPGEGQPVPIIGLNGQTAVDPLLLDGLGQVLPYGGNPVFLRFNVYPSKPFNALFLFGLDGKVTP
jgi:hypothetical protein